jgi:hypothetical protein
MRLVVISRTHVSASTMRHAAIPEDWLSARRQLWEARLDRFDE